MTTLAKHLWQLCELLTDWKKTFYEFGTLFHWFNHRLLH